MPQRYCEVGKEPPAARAYVGIVENAFDVADRVDLMISGWLIFLAMVFDALDGYVARLAGADEVTGSGEICGGCNLVVASQLVDRERHGARRGPAGDGGGSCARVRR